MGHPFKVNDQITLIEPRFSDPYFIQYQRTVKVIEVIGDQVRVEHWPAPTNRQEYVMPADRFRPARKMGLPR